MIDNLLLYPNNSKAENQISSTLLLLSGGGGQAGDPQADPGSVDPSNTVLILDGDVDLAITGSDGTWVNKVGDQATMIFGNANSKLIAELNGHDVVHTWGGHATGLTGKGEIQTPVIDLTNSELVSYYLVFNIAAHVGNKALYDDGVTTINQRCLATAYQITSGGAAMVQPQTMPTGKWVIMCWTFNGSSSTIRTHIQDGSDSGVVTGSLSMTKLLSGLTIGGATSNYGQLDVDFAYVMIRLGQDSTTIQDEIFTKMKSRFGF